MQTQAPIRHACAASGGSNGLDARFTNAFSVKDCRTSATAASLIRRPTDVRPNASGDRTIEVRTGARQRQTIHAAKLPALRAILARADAEGIDSKLIGAIRREVSRREGK